MKRLARSRFLTSMLVCGLAAVAVTYGVNLMWANQRRRITLANRADIGSAQVMAEEIVGETGLPYGGVYDSANRIWLEGPFHRAGGAPDEIPPDIVATPGFERPLEFDDPVPGPQGPPPHSAPPHPAAPVHEAPPALGDDAGMNNGTCQ